MKHTFTSKGPTCDKSFAFAMNIISICRDLNKKREFVLSKQLLRSGTAIGALAREARHAESKKDFIHKLAIAQKECDETIYWLDLLHETQSIDTATHKNLESRAQELMRLITSSIVTTKSKL